MTNLAIYNNNKIYIMQTKGKPFVFPGVTDVTDCKTSKEVMEAAGLDWTVAKCPLVAKMPIADNNIGFNYLDKNYVDVDNIFATYRTDKNIPLGIVKGKYTPVQNIDAFKFFDNAIDRNKAVWQTAGCFDEGKRIFVSAKLPNLINVHNDPVDNYLVFITSHDGSSGVKILLTPIRIICENTLSAAIRNASNYVSFRHTTSVHKNIDIANEILGLCDKKIDYVNQMYNEMYKSKVTDDKAEELFAKVILSENEFNNIKHTGHTVKQVINKNCMALQDAEISTNKANVLNNITKYYHTGIGQKQIEGTAWGVVNAISGYYCNVDNIEGSKRMDSLLYGDKSRKLETANNLVLEY